MTKRKKTITFLRIAVLVLAFFRVRHRYGSLQEGLLLLIEQIHTTRWFIVLFAIFFVVRPLLLIPVGMLSVVAGVLRGRWPGLPLVLVGEITSAMIAYTIGRKLSRSSLHTKNQNRFSNFAFVLLKHPFRAVLLSRLSPLPDDVINYGRGITRISRKPYFRGSLFGNAPFSILNVAVGAQISIDTMFREGLTSAVDWRDMSRLIVAYALLLLGGTLIMHHVSGKTKESEPKDID